MVYTLHTWEIQNTENGIIAVNIAQRSTTSHRVLMTMLRGIMGTGTQFYVDRYERPLQAAGRA